MLTKEDLETLQKKGMSEEDLNAQIERFKTGFPYMKVERAAVMSDGIDVLDEKARLEYIGVWERALAQGKKVVKFVPASGAASRMFKSLFEFVDDGGKSEMSTANRSFFDNIERFAFYDALNQKCKRNEGRDIPLLKELSKEVSIAETLLNKRGLNYGSLPKGLLLFHRYAEGGRTPFEEHLVEGALYAKNRMGNVSLHFTVSPEHLSLFKSLLRSKVSDYSYRYGANYDVSFSVQEASTDTVAVDEANEPFRVDGKLFFRPGGHGALIENLNKIDADVIFIKNIDNVSPDVYKQPTVEYKMVLAGKLLAVQEKVLEYQALLDSSSVSDEQIRVMLDFCQKQLHVENRFNPVDTKEDKLTYLRMILNRPIRVCGMVKNEGEPGGGPYMCQNPNGTVSAQILESSQFNMEDEAQVSIMKGASHFNPVDLVCAVKNCKGEKYDLRKFVDPNTGFISHKSKNGKALKALELPGLWNGAMSDWNTIFVEVPIETFTPVKTVVDLLRPEHQG